MPTFDFTSPEGKTYSIDGPEGSTKEQAFQMLQTHLGSAKPTPQKEQSILDRVVQTNKNIGGGLLRGAGSIGATAMRLLPNALGGDTAEQNTERRNAMDSALGSMGADTNSLGYGAGKLGAEIAGTAGAGGVLGNIVGRGAQAFGLGAKAAPLVNALTSSGMTTGAKLAPNAAWLGAKGADMALRMGAGGAVGAASAGATGDSALAGGVVGGVLPGALKVAGGAGQYAGNQVSNLVKPFTGEGQNELASNLFKSFATDPEKARQAMASFKQVVPGSEPIAAAASGDVGLSNLTRTMQNASKDFAGDLQTRQWAQNAARTNAIESVAGNEGKIGVAKIARDKATDSMRSEALNAAGMVKSNQLVEALDLMAANPDSAGKLSQAALSELKNQILKASKNGEIDSRALYAIRKDINTTLGGKLSGDAGNLRYAAGELTGAKGAIDDAIEAAIQASMYKPSGSKTGTDLVTTGNALVVGARKTPSFKGYLEEYAKQSKPINQMEALQDVMKRAQTGSVDNQGNLILSSAKLNNILKNETEELKKVLTDDQLQLIRNLSADTNASTLGMTAGKAVGSNTVQNIAQDNLLAGLMGQKMGGSTPVKMLLGNAFKPAYIRSNQAIMDKVGEALLSPKSGAAMLDTPAYRNKLQELLTSEEGKKLLLLLSKSAPVAIAQ